MVPVAPGNVFDDLQIIDPEEGIEVSDRDEQQEVTVA